MPDIRGREPDIYHIKLKSTINLNYELLFQDIAEDSIDTNSAYILFYERSGLDVAKYMPDIRDREPDIADIDDECESDIKKMCSVM